MSKVCHNLAHISLAVLVAVMTTKTANALNKSHAQNCSNTCINNQCNYRCDTKNSERIIEAKGPIIQKDLPLHGDIHHVELIGVNASFVRKKTPKITASGKQNILDELKVRYRKNTIYIHLTSGSYRHAKVQLDIELPNIQSVKLKGSNQLHINGVSQKSAIFELFGSNTFIAKNNHIEELSLFTDGTNNINWQTSSRIESLTINSNGMNTIKITPKSLNLLQGQLNGINQLVLCNHDKNISRDLIVKGLSSVSNQDC